MLSEELFKIKSTRSPHVDGDAEGDDVHCWRLRLGRFGKDTPLGRDLAELARRYPCTGADTVELRLRYKADLFPFYPPSVDVVRPRLRGGVRGALMAHPLLRPSSWRWTTTCPELLERLRGFMELHARVDFSVGEVNNPAIHPAGAHSDPLSLLDGALVHMGALHGCIPEAYAPLYEQQDEEQPCNPMPHANWANTRGSAAPSSGASAAVPMEVDPEVAPPGLVGEDDAEEGEGDLPSDGLPRKRKAAGRKYYWSKGTGYGYDGDGGPSERWDPVKASATQEAQDEATQRMATQVTQLLRQMRDESGELAEQAARCVSGSALGPLLAKELHGRSIVDMAARGAYYSSLLWCIVEAARIGAAANLGCVAERLGGIETQAKLFFRLSKPTPAAKAATSAGSFAEECSDEAMAQGQGAAAVATSVATSAEAAAAATAVTEAAAASDDAALAQLVLEASDALRSALRSLQTPSRSGPPAVQAAAAAGAATSSGRRVTRLAARAASAPALAASPAAEPAGGSADEARAYVAALGGLLLDTCPSLSGEHHYRADTRLSVPAAAQQRRVAKECAGLAALLPCTPSSSVFVRAEEASTSLWRALITGPEGTPYAGGCFVFGACLRAPRDLNAAALPYARRARSSLQTSSSRPPTRRCHPR
jgi:baculoviral IAP repeat-containing protein 6